jgi:Icc protein
VTAGGSRERDGAQSISHVHVFEDSIVTTVSPIGSYGTVGAFVSPQQVDDRLDEYAARISGRP